jgi:hypothetical protein
MALSRALHFCLGMKSSLLCLSFLVASLPLIACTGRIASPEIDPAPKPLGPVVEPVPAPTTTAKPPAPPSDDMLPEPPSPEPPRPEVPTVCRANLEVLDCNTAAGYKVQGFDAPVVTHDEAGREVLYLGVYEAENRGFQEHAMGHATVLDDRTAPHTLVLTSYEGVRWNIATAPGSGLERVITAGYYEQQVQVTGKKVSVEHRGRSQVACGYSYPYNGEGCDTDNALAAASTWAGAPVSQMAGCYQASLFRVSDGKCTEPGQKWKAHAFKADSTTSACAGGERFVRFDSKYQKWVGAELCSSTSYKLYLGESLVGEFAPIADSSGHGQDHCELVNPTFSLPNDDDATSGGCPTCQAQAFEPWSWPGAKQVYVRSRTGEAFELESWLRWESPHGPISPHITAGRYSCGVSIP